MTQFLTKKQGMWGFIVLMTFYFGASSWLAFRLPAFIAPNEVLNYEYISVMRQIGGLPNRGLVDVEIRYNEWHQPPVYFLWAGLVSAAVPVDPAPNPPPPLVFEKNPFFTSTPRGNINPYVNVDVPLYDGSRLAAALLGLLCLAAFYRWTSRLYSPSVALLMLSLLAFQPNFLFFSTNINNDMPLTAVSAVTLSAAVWIVVRQKGAWGWFGLGLLTALTILTKANGVFALAYLGTAGLLQLWQSRQFWATVKLGLAALAGLVPLWAAWLVLNTVRMRDALGVSGSLPVRDVLLEGPRHLLLLIPLREEIWRSFWLDWSVGDLALGPDWIYLLGLGIVLVGLAGWLRPRPWPYLSHAPRTLWIVVLGMAAISLLYFSVKALSAFREGTIVPEGRWWLPVWPALVWLVVLGFQRWWPAKWRPTVNLLATAVPLLLMGYLLVSYVPHFYPQAERLTAVPDETDLTRVGLEYGDRLALVGIEQQGTLDVPLDDHTAVDFVWRVLDSHTIDQQLVFSTQLIVTRPDGWEPLVQHNSYPGLGRSPTTAWQVGEVWRDEVVLAPQTEDLLLNGPTQAALAVWLSDADGRLPVVRQAEPAEPPFVFPAVLRPNLALPPELWPAPVRFGEVIELIAAARDGDELVLWWRSVAPTEAYYTAFVHLLDDAGNVVVQADGVPNDGLSPTAVWLPGEVVRDVRQIAPDGAVALGLYDPTTGARLTAVDMATGERLLNDAVQIPPAD